MVQKGNKMRILKVAVVIGAIGLTSIVSAIPAFAATGSIIDNGNGTITATYSGFTLAELFICDTSIAASSCTPINATYVYGGAGGPGNSLAASPATISAGMSARTGNAGGYSATTIAAGTYNVKLFDNATPTFTATLSNAVLGSGGGGSASAPAATPQTFELSLTPTDGTTCTSSSESGAAGTWINMPAANDCTPPASKPNAKLLGWATSPNFPVAIAKRQVDNGWGAYETFNINGQLTGVFIPAGGSTLVSATGTLHTIWSE